MTTEHNCVEATRWLACPFPSCNQGYFNAGGTGIQAPCDVCGATGLRFSMLSRECLGSPRGRHGDTGSQFDCVCQGRGRVPVDGLDEWLDAADTLGGWALTRYVMESGYSVAFHSLKGIPEASAPTRLEAIAEAICRALSQHPEVVDPTCQEVAK